MATSDDLFELIKRLTPQERRYLQRMVMAERDGEGVPNYLKLFHDLSKLERYDEKQFLKTHQSEGYAASFPQNKIYLYNLILNFVLRGQRKIEKSKEFQIRELVEEALALKQKMLFDQSLRRLEKARKEAEKFQFYELLLEILKLLRTHVNEHPDKDYVKKLKEILKQIDWIGTQIQTNCEILRYRDELFLAVRIGKLDPIQDKSHEQGLDLKTQLEAAVDKLSSVEARSNVYLCLALLHQLADDWESAWKYHHLVYILWRESEAFREARRTQYQKILNNYLTISLVARKDIDFIEALEFLEKGPFHSLDESAESKQNTMYIRLQYFITSKKWADALQVEKSFREKQEWVTQKMQRPRLMAFYMNLARLHVILNNPKSAKNYLHYIDAEYEEGILNRTRAEAKLLEVLLEFDFDHAIKLETNIRGIRRMFEAFEQKPRFFKVFFSGLNKILSVPSKERNNEWNDLLVKIVAARPKAHEESVFELLHAWIIAQRDQKAIHEILKEVDVFAT